MEATPGRLMHLSLMQGQARALLCDTTLVVEAARMTHGTSRVCTAALGRTATAAGMLASMLKGSEESLTLTIRGDGPIGMLVAVARPGVVKAYAQHPTVELPLRADGKLDVGAAVGKQGRLTVVKDLGMREPYVGQCSLHSGEIAEDIAYYCTVSEQQPTLCALGVLAADKVLAAGGLIIQPLPGCSEEVLRALELRAPLYGDISGHIQTLGLDALVEGFFRGLQPEVLAETPLRFACDCSRERMERALIALSREDIDEMIAQGDPAELTCQFCHAAHSFDVAQLRAIRSQREA